jgi:D-serine deaminase-like pyridoxal phosphate-dependent protein
MRTQVSEGEILASKGVTDIFISNVVIDPRKLDRICHLSNHLSKHGGRLSVAVDSHEGLARLARAVLSAPPQPDHPLSVFVEVDVGGGRCGVSPGEPAADLVAALVGTPGLAFAGLHCYNGAAQHLRSHQERERAVAAAARDVGRSVCALRKRGVAVPLVTGAGTGTFALDAVAGAWGEIQAGSYLFFDADYAANAHAQANVPPNAPPDVADADANANANANADANAPTTDAKTGDVDVGAPLFSPGGGGRGGVSAEAQPAFEHALFVKAQVITVAKAYVVLDAGHKSHAIDCGMPVVLGRKDVGVRWGLCFLSSFFFLLLFLSFPLFFLFFFFSFLLPCSSPLCFFVPSFSFFLLLLFLFFVFVFVFRLRLRFFVHTEQTNKRTNE